MRADSSLVFLHDIGDIAGLAWALAGLAELMVETGPALDRSGFSAQHEPWWTGRVRRC